MGVKNVDDDLIRAPAIKGIVEVPACKQELVSVDQLEYAMAVAEAAAREAAEVIMQYRFKVLVKQKDAGEGPVTEADLAADRIIRGHIETAFPGDTCISEESFEGVGNAVLPTKGRVWHVDPLDGTKCYIDPNSSDFCIMIGLVIDGVPAAGLIMEPATGRLWKGVNGQEYRQAWHMAPGEAPTQLPPLPSTLASSQLRFGAAPPVHPRFERLISEHVMPARAVPKGSAGLKAMLIVDGESDMYTSGCKQISIWDIAAAHAILAAVGGGLCTLDLKPINYAQKQLRDGLFFYNPGLDGAMKERVRGMYQHLAEQRRLREQQAAH
uniref:3'(2'),5'-bisphosphate nucleotidase 1 n=2 Tax=Pyramimonas obovata TaxID=1411642 RepID=A0A7S0QMA2_9CHLO|mmetsp:Transcript_10764/g.22412  ORF Transcript_10764/g.22412 Transcript_10764/m.22412 type:complete len:324 (+) Transcript_10764:349-1320(+)